MPKTSPTKNLGDSPNETNIKHMKPYFRNSPDLLTLSNVDTIVLHWTGGSTLNGAVDYLWTTLASYHFIIDKDGTVIQTKPLNEKSNHAGCSYGPNGIDVNTSSIGISFVTVGGFGVENLINDNQFQNAVKLIGDINDAIKLEVTNHNGIKWITTHYQVSPARKEDPYSLEMDMTQGRNIIKKVSELTGNKITYWQAGMGPTWPKGLNQSCKCIDETIVKTVDGEIKWCKKSKGNCSFSKTTKNCTEKYKYDYETMSVFINKKLKDRPKNGDDVLVDSIET